MQFGHRIGNNQKDNSAVQHVPLYFMQFTGQNNGGTASPAFLLPKKCNSLARTCIMNMREDTNFKGSDLSCPSTYDLFYDLE